MSLQGPIGINQTLDEAFQSALVNSALHVLKRKIVERFLLVSAGYDILRRQMEAGIPTRPRAGRPDRTLRKSRILNVHL